MPDDLTVDEALRAFVAERDWGQFHTPVNLAKSICDRGWRAPRSVWVKAEDPVACSTVRPCLDSSPSKLSAMTLFPEPGPPVTMTTCFVVAVRARSRHASPSSRPPAAGR